MTSVETRQQRRFHKRHERKAEQRHVPTAKQQRLAFKAAKAKFAEVDAVIQKSGNDVAARIVGLRLLLPLRHRGKGRGGFEHRYGNGSSHTPHQGKQERFRRLVGGFAQCRRLSAMTKREAIARLGKHTGNLKRAADLPMEAALA